MTNYVVLDARSEALFFQVRCWINVANRVRVFSTVAQEVIIPTGKGDYREGETKDNDACVLCHYEYGVEIQSARHYVCGERRSSAHTVKLLLLYCRTRGE